MKHYLGIDIGGTHIKGGVVDLANEQTFTKTYYLTKN